MNHSNITLYNELKKQLDDLLLDQIYTINKAVVFDIDGTLYREGVYNPANDNEMFHAVSNFLQYCNDIYVHVFIITARPAFKENIEKTEQDLQSHNFRYHKIFFCKPNSNPFICKKMFRDTIHAHGYRLMMSIGDNLCDLDKRIPYNYLVKLHKNGECEYILNP